MLILENQNILDLVDQGAIGIPTNGYVGRNGAGVMGAGIALDAKRRYPGIGYELGTHLKREGNVVGWLMKESVRLISIPVKPVKLNIVSEEDFDQVLPRVRNQYHIGSTVPGFHCKAKISLIEQSLIQLTQFIIKHDINQVFLPLLGCGNGGLSITVDLLPLLERLDLPDSTVLVIPDRVGFKR